MLFSLNGNLHMVSVKDSMVDQVKVLPDKSSISPSNDKAIEHIQDSLRLLGLERSKMLQAEFIAKYGLKVQAGLFEGMEYLPDCAEGCYIPKLLGCYEAELEPYFRQAIAKPYQAIVNVGCSEGFYAVGLARLMPQVQVYAHDTNEAAWADCQQLASQNGVIDRIHIGGTFVPMDFQEFADQKTLVLCDIEGGEEALLDPKLAPALSQMDIIVELHSGFVPNIQEILIQRFEKTHEISIVPHTLRGITLPPLLQEWSSLDQLLALCEWRAFPTPWLVIWAKSPI
jgi:hypothetical protein